MSSTLTSSAKVFASVVKLVNTGDLKSPASACRFESDHSHQVYPHSIMDNAAVF